MSENSSPNRDSANPFLSGSIGAVFVRTSVPIVLVTLVNGLLTVVDAMLLGAFVGTDALSAVTLVFPFSMLLVAAATMVGIGMASVLGRRLGARDLDGARQTLAAAQGLALAVSVLAAALFFIAGSSAVGWVTGGNARLGDMAWTFLAISFATAPVTFLLSVQSDALRTEGRVAFMAIAGVIVTLANIALNALFIGAWHFGVAGSAWGTALAQLVALGVILAYRLSGKSVLPVVGLRCERSWMEMLSLGLPRSLNFIGISLGSAAVLFALRQLELAQPEATIAAYGVATRLMTFAFLPLMGMSLALQAIAGNNAGAGMPERAMQGLRLAVTVSAAYGVVVMALLIGGRDVLGHLFVGEVAVVREVARIVPVYVAAYFAFGPVMMAAAYVQALGRVRQAALLSLGRTYCFAIPLTLLLPLIWGETGVWAAAPVADLLMLAVTLLVWQGSQSRLAAA